MLAAAGDPSAKEQGRLIAPMLGTGEQLQSSEPLTEPAHRPEGSREPTSSSTRGGRAGSHGPNPEVKTWRTNMGKAKALKITVTIAAIVATSSASAQMTHLQRPCPLEGETIMVTVQEVPNLEQRCYELLYENQKGYVCVWAGGTPDRPYGFTTNFQPEHVTKDGWTAAGGGNVGCKAEQCFRSLCRQLVRKHKEETGRTNFDPDSAAEKLDEFFEPTARSKTPEQSQE